MGKTTIEWADMVINPVHGCTKVSEGCRNCYAERIYNRFWHGQSFGVIKTIPHALTKIPNGKPQRIFVNSMADLFHKDVSDEFIWSCFKKFSEYPQHTFMILTKRPERMQAFIKSFSGDPFEKYFNNVWLGVSVEDQGTANERIPILLQTPAALRFVSVEPMLGPINLRKYTWPICWCWNAKYRTPEEAIKAGAYAEEKRQSLVGADRNFIDWVICGGETGTNAREMKIEWASSLKDQCEATNTPFFFKSWGDCHKSWESRIGGLEYHQFPEAFL